jgi:chromosome segregation ATPase
MIRNIKKILNEKIDNFHLKAKYQNYFKQSLLSNLNKIKSKINILKLSNIKNEDELTQEIIHSEHSKANISVLEKTINNQNTSKVKIVENVDFEINDKKFLKKKLNRKLNRLKRKIKRYKFTKSDEIDKKINMTEQTKTPLEELNSKVSNLQNELKKIQSQESLNVSDVEIKKLKNKYKRKIKKLKNKINKFSKIKSASNVIHIVKEEENKENKVQPHQETKELNDNSEYEKRIEEYQLENTSLKSKIQEFENNNKNNLYEKDKDKVKELEEKLKHYQEENVRLSNQIFNQDKKIEIMRNQISNFENLKQKLYEQVNTLGDTLLDNDNVENIFEKNSSLENFDENEKIKIVNSTQEISETNSKYEDKNLVKTSSNSFDARNLDKDIKNIFSN